MLARRKRAVIVGVYRYEPRKQIGIRNTPATPDQRTSDNRSPKSMCGYSNKRLGYSKKAHLRGGQKRVFARTSPHSVEVALSKQFNRIDWIEFGI